MATPAPRLDAHQHFWRYDAAQYPWIPEGSPLHRDWLPADLGALQAEVNLHGSVAVQARQTLEESHWLLELAATSPVIKAVVGWVDLRAVEVERDLAVLAAQPKFAGVRHVVQDEPDDDFMRGADFQRGISSLARFGITYDLLIYPRQLPAAIALVEKFPDQPFVLDHIAKPPIRDGSLSPWRELIGHLGQAPHVMCKLSGMVTEADHAHWKPADFQRYLEIVLEAFGPDRLMFGSDWPVCLLAAEYRQTLQLVTDFIQPLPEAAQNAILGGNCARFYRIPT